MEHYTDTDRKPNNIIDEFDIRERICGNIQINF